jgi:acetylornithine/N-succinyldiaminopimelate aminotransferase
MGRTGHLFAYEKFGVQPDVMTLAKALGGGFPVGACLATEKAASGITPGTHGSTFGGNPLAMAVANAVLDILLSNGFLVQSRAMGEFLFDKILKFSKKTPRAFEDVRGFGLMIGLKCIPPVGDFVLACRKAGLLTVPAGENVMRLLPPLNVDETQIGEAMEKLEFAWETIAK